MFIDHFIQAEAERLRLAQISARCRQPNRHGEAEHWWAYARSAQCADRSRYATKGALAYWFTIGRGTNQGGWTPDYTPNYLEGIHEQFGEGILYEVERRWDQAQRKDQNLNEIGDFWRQYSSARLPDNGPQSLQIPRLQVFQESPDIPPLRIAMDPLNCKPTAACEVLFQFPPDNAVRLIESEMARAVRALPAEQFAHGTEYLADQGSIESAASSADTNEVQPGYLDRVHNYRQMAKSYYVPGG